MVFSCYPISLSLLLASLIFTDGMANAADVAAGRQKSAMCAACHGATGISSAPIYPNLAGQKEQYLVTAITAYKNRDRNNPMMTPLAASLSDDDIKNLAAYYAHINCQ